MACDRNIIATVTRFSSLRRSIRGYFNIRHIQSHVFVHSLLITNLAMADLVMGVYMMTIAIVDLYYHGRYIAHDLEWRASVMCKVCGFLSTFSSELSVLTLTVITVDRLVCIMFPFRIKRLNVRGVYKVIAALWLLSSVIAAVPLINTPSLIGVYSRSGVCLALPLTGREDPGWLYTVIVYLVVNFLSFVIIFVSYVAMYTVAQKSQNSVRTKQMKNDRAMLKRVTMIILSDFLCWFPIIVLGILALSGVPIPGVTFSWTAVFVLPLNAAVNPLLYTLATAPFAVHITKKMAKFRYSFKSSVTTDRYTMESRRCSKYSSDHSTIQQPSTSARALTVSSRNLNSDSRHNNQYIKIEADV